MTIVDALRGFALAGIVLVHMAEQYAGAPLPGEAMAKMSPGLADQIYNGFIQLFLTGKFFALFSFLFGLSFFIQMDRAAQRGQAFEVRFLWRLILLLGIGYLHHLFYRGDILTIYAILGLLLIPFYRLSNRNILIFAAILFLGLGRYVVFATTHSTSIFFEDLLDFESAVVLDYYQTLIGGSLIEVFQTNAWSGHVMKADFQIGVFGRAYLTFGFFLLGLWVGRIRYFRDFMNLFKVTRRLLWISLGLFFLGIIGAGFFFFQLGPEPDMSSWTAMFGLTAYDLSNLGMTGIILAGFVLLFRKPRFERVLQAFAPYGRMALSNYVLQSLVGTFIFYGWGLGYLTEIRMIYTLLMALLLVALQMLWSQWWLKRYYYGPLEWLWRSLTFWRRFPLRRS